MKQPPGVRRHDVLGSGLIPAIGKRKQHGISPLPRSLKKANSNWHLAIGQTKTLRPSADWYWVWDWDWVWVTLGSPKGHPRATQASPMGRFAEVPLFATKGEK